MGRREPSRIPATDSEYLRARAQHRTLALSLWRRHLRQPPRREGLSTTNTGARSTWCGGPAGERKEQYRHGERTKAAIAERQGFSTLLICCAGLSGLAGVTRNSAPALGSSPRAGFGTLCERTGYFT
jgi:hypothetical protein